MLIPQSRPGDRNADIHELRPPDFLSIRNPKSTIRNRNTPPCFVKIENGCTPAPKARITGTSSGASHCHAKR